MNARLSEGNVLSVMKRILGFAGLVSLVLVCAGPVSAQSQPAQTESPAVRAVAATPSTSPGAGPAESAPVTKQSVAQHSIAKAAAQRGNSEGITVHGHWTIEVKNPDGKLVTHREFENSLAGTGGGAPVLAGILGRAVTVGSWQVYLAADATGDFPLVITEPNSQAAGTCPNITFLLYQGCFNTLSVTGAQLGTGGISSGTLTGNTVTLQGTLTVPKGYSQPSILLVITQNLLCAPSDSPAACFSDPNSFQQALTSRNLDGQGTDPAPVAITTGQTVSVTVVLSFGSGS